MFIVTILIIAKKESHLKVNGKRNVVHVHDIISLSCKEKKTKLAREIAH